MSQADKTGPEQKKRSRKGRRHNDIELPSSVQAVFDQAVKEAAGKPMSMEEDSPLGRVIGSFVEHCLDEELRQHLGYDRHERIEPTQSGESRRTNTRNGYSSKQLKTSMGSTEIEVPRDRLGEFTPQILQKHQTMSQEIESRVISMYAHGMSTRDIAEHVRSLYHFDASEDFVSRLVERIDPELTAWRNRPLESVYAIVYVDALHLKIRHSTGVQSTAAYIVSGYGESGHHDVLGIWINENTLSAAHGESASFWHTVFVSLEKRGLQSILIACSDGLSGLPEALELVYAQARHTPCVVHLMRASLARVSYSQRKAIAAELKRIYQAPSYEAAEAALEECAQKNPAVDATVIQRWRENLPRLQPLWSYSQALRRLVYTTNPQENINRQVRKVTKNRAALPSLSSALRLLTLVVRDIDTRAQQRDVRPDWVNIVKELHLHFSGSLPNDWGLR